MSTGFLKKIHAIMSMGYSLDQACQYVGINETMYHHWLKLEKQYQLQNALKDVLAGKKPDLRTPEGIMPL